MLCCGCLNQVACERSAHLYRKVTSGYSRLEGNSSGVPSNPKRRADSSPWEKKQNTKGHNLLNQNSNVQLWAHLSSTLDDVPCVPQCLCFAFLAQNCCFKGSPYTLLEFLSPVSNFPYFLLSMFVWMDQQSQKKRNGWEFFGFSNGAW